ncbi:Cof-type HAD-IIB family hydrolase [Phocaeicola sp.]|uniref:Cof-type HAD-IIB family hydrolase n=1 Tax=Phocaeicola sp. TaxID=2773926 RepID=UPI00386FEBBA
MKYKLLVLDLDGTLTNTRKEVTEHTRTTLIKAQEQGLKIVLASGRPTYGIAPLANLLQLDKYEGYVLSYNGGEIIDWKTGELLYKNLLDPEVLPYLYQCANDNHFAIVTYDGEYVLTEYPDDKYVLKEALLNVMKIKKVDNFLKAVQHPIAKCLIVGEPTRLAVLEKEMYNHLHDRMGVFRSEPYFLELVPKGIDKAQSLAVLLKEIGMTKDEMIAVGDGFNDLSMIKYAGLGVAMSNAQEVVKENADFITLSNEEDGVAHVVEKFILSENTDKSSFRYHFQ